MSSSNSRTVKSFASPPNQRFRLLTAREKPARCEWFDCSKPATGLVDLKVYCSAHFFSAVSQHWRAEPGA